MPKQIVIAEQYHVAAVFAEDRIDEFVVAAGKQQVGDIYLGVVENIIPGIDAAFVNIGDAERNGFMHVTDLGPLRQKRSAGTITELLVPYQKVLVQVMKEPTSTKGPRLTGNITLPGRYVVLMPYGKGVNLSQRISQDSERNRLRALGVLTKPAGMGLLVRTEAEGQPEETIVEDLESLQSQWEQIQEQAGTAKPPALLTRDDDFIQRVLRDSYSSDVNRIVVDSDPALKQVKQQLTNWNGGQKPSGVVLDRHRESQPILDYFRITATIREALKPRVELPSGGHIVIEPTEALTVVDVNSGSFTRSATARETVLWTNCEAAWEIARQLRLRKIGGVIIVDFIDMESRRDQLRVLEYFDQALQADKAKPQIAQLSELGLIELTRKREGKSLYELFSQTCTSCEGLGRLARLPGEPDGERPSGPQQRPSLSEAKATDGAPAAGDDAGSDRDLELLNHPDYRGRRGGERRGSRRRRNGKSGTSKSSGEASPPSESASQKATGSARSPRGKGKSRSERNQTPAPASEASPTEADGGTGKPPSRSRARSDRSAASDKAPLETVTVEMTPQEQQVYALMGLSPLVRLDREISNPQSVVAQVRPPAEASAAPAASAPQAASGDSNQPSSGSARERSTVTPPRRRRRRRSASQDGNATQS
jgi:ribonuclease E